jgi:hypothetical protein
MDALIPEPSSISPTSSLISGSLNPADWATPMNASRPMEVVTKNMAAVQDRPAAVPR